MFHSHIECIMFCIVLWDWWHFDFLYEQSDKMIYTMFFSILCAITFEVEAAKIQTESHNRIFHQALSEEYAPKKIVSYQQSKDHSVRDDYNLYSTTCQKSTHPTKGCPLGLAKWDCSIDRKQFYQNYAKYVEQWQVKVKKKQNSMIFDVFGWKK